MIVALMMNYNKMLHQLRYLHHFSQLNAQYFEMQLENLTHVVSNSFVRLRECCSLEDYTGALLCATITQQPTDSESSIYCSVHILESPSKMLI